MIHTSSNTRDAATGRCATGARRTAYTLLELIAVATLMVVAVALTVPSYNGLMAIAHVDASGDMIRARMADARAMAMENGKPFRFAFMPGTGKFQVAADDSDVWNSSQNSEPFEADDQIVGELHPDVVFSTDPDSSGTGGAAAGGSQWVVGGIFLPTGEARGPINADGTSVDDVTFYFGIQGTPPTGVRLRGLTGIVRVFAPNTDEADQP